MSMLMPIIHEVAVATEDNATPYCRWYSYGDYDDMGKVGGAKYVYVRYNGEWRDMLCEYIRITNNRAYMFQPIGNQFRKAEVAVNYYNMKRGWQPV